MAQITRRYPESDRLAALANDALRAFREENAEGYKELVKVYEGKSADLVLLGHGRLSIAVSKGEVQISADKLAGKAAHGRAAASPETLLAMLEGRLTPLEAFFKGDLAARAESAELHRAYDYLVRFSDAALRSRRMQQIVAEFKTIVRAEAR